MKAMAHKYVQEFPNHGMMAGKPETEVVLVTGTSGALGSHIIAQLLQSPEIATVYALNRPGSNLHDRQRASFSAQGVDLNFLQSPKLKLLAGDLNLPEFGLSRDDYDALTDNVTTIIHNGMNFAAHNANRTYANRILN
jgi:thioester reductase-like protein